MSGGSERLFSDKFTRQAVEDVSEEAKKLELISQLKTDIKNETVARPPTRIERKFKRIFGAAGQTSNLFVTGFKMGALVGGGFGAAIGTYQAVKMRNFAVIPLAMVGTGFSFGCTMGLSAMIRSGDM
eukprot:Macronucleus_7132.p2 GENE.Macronucleus_7132~~Macronucleus_7132.p2  ORF type:complete len:127 (+),score=14.84 Macronucleus_7132:1-381(+)